MFENRTKCTQVGFLVGGIEMLIANEVFDFFKFIAKKCVLMHFNGFRYWFFHFLFNTMKVWLHLSVSITIIWLTEILYK
jgi:hypothetical protein